MFTQLITFLCTIPIVLLILHTIIRFIRHYKKFPIPEWMTNIIDNPFRRKIQPPSETAYRHGIVPGMQVLEVGPGNGTYTFGAAHQVGPEGLVITVDIEPKIINRLKHRIENEGINNIDARVANVYSLPFEDQSFDLIFMITVINEIPDIPKALKEFHRVLKNTGTLVFSELLLDPDYPLASTLIRKTEAEKFRLREKIGNFFYYTLIFEKENIRH
jgi:ubiquinone/menaquinone biosynthesis C-methylase UbiE